MKKKVLLLFLTCLASASLKAQQKEYLGLPSLTWPKLMGIKLEKAQDEFGEYDKPVFSEDVKFLEGTEVYLPGYIIPFSGGGAKSKYFILSALPLYACFFCGEGGPESVIEVYLDRDVLYTEKPIEVKGKLKLNDSDPDKMFYILEDAEYLGEIDF